MTFIFMANVHIGKKIKELVRKSGMTRVEFAKHINSSRSNLYDIFERNEIDTRLMVKISKVLGHDLSVYYAIEPLEVREDKMTYHTRQDVQHELNLLKKELKELQKNYTFLEKINSLLEEKLIEQRKLLVKHGVIEPEKRKPRSKGKVVAKKKPGKKKR